MPTEAVRRKLPVYFAVQAGMKIENEGGRMRISELPELTAVNAETFRAEVRAALQSPDLIELDLSQTRMLDSSGLGELFALYRMMCDGRGVTLRLLNPNRDVHGLLELMQLHHLFEIVRHST